MPSGAETWECLEARVGNELRTILDSGYERIVVVSHGGIMRVMYALLLGLSPHGIWNVSSYNCSISGVEIRGTERSLVFSNDDLHLKEIPEGVRLPVW